MAVAIIGRKMDLGGQKRGVGVVGETVAGGNGGGGFVFGGIGLYGVGSRLQSGYFGLGEVYGYGIY